MSERRDTQEERDERQLYAIRAELRRGIGDYTRSNRAFWWWAGVTLLLSVLLLLLILLFLFTGDLALAKYAMIGFAVVVGGSCPLLFVAYGLRAANTVIETITIENTAKSRLDKQKRAQLEASNLRGSLSTAGIDAQQGELTSAREEEAEASSRQA